MLDVPEISQDLNIEESINEALEQIMMTSIKNNNEHSAIVCVVCDRFIIGTENISWIQTSELKRNEERLSVTTYQKNLGYDLPNSLKAYYCIDDIRLSNMLLSKNATKHSSTDCYSCCDQCKRALNRRVKTPPKYSIANGFAIGSLPDEMSISDLVSLMIAPIRPFSYVISYGGGSYKKLKGVVTFFENSPDKMGSALQDFSSVSQNPNVYIILCGRMTPKQK